MAWLIEPPLSTFDEASWLHAVLDATGCDLLLDLHNVHANAANFGFDAEGLVRSLSRSDGAVHLAGGRRIERGRILDDHLHGVPDEVFELLGHVSADDALVILERDGNYPPIEELLAELRRARVGVRQPHTAALRPNIQKRQLRLPHSKSSVEFLAVLYTDAASRERFLANPEGFTHDAGFSEDEAREFACIDKDDLMLAARGFEKKRAAKRA